MTMTTTKPQILIIDDQMESVALLLQYFQGQNIDVMTALDGEDGLRKARVANPDLILLDVFMPDKNGYAVCLELKKDAKTAHVPVIFLSAGTTLDSKLNGFAVGGADYISKPFSSEEVLARVFVHLQYRRTRPVSEPDTPEPDPVSTRDVQIITMAVAHLQDPEREWQGTDQLARRIGVNEKKLNEIFRAQFGMTVSEYQLHQRLENSRLKLANTTLQIQVIARQAGYSNASDFSRAFRLRYGLGPRQYRQVTPSQLPSPSTNHSNLHFAP